MSLSPFHHFLLQQHSPLYPARLGVAGDLVSLHRDDHQGARPGTAQKADKYLGDFWTSQPEQVFTFSLATTIREVSSEAQIP